MMDIVIGFMRASMQALEEETNPAQRAIIKEHIVAFEAIAQACERELVRRLGGATVIGVIGGYHVPLVSLN